MERHLFLILFWTLILKTNSQGNGPLDTSVTECVVPPPDAIRNGKFQVREDYLNIHLPDGKLHSYDLRVTCNPGYESVPRGRAPLVTCIVNKTREQLPECLPTCKRNAPDILSCGAGADNLETKCILPSGVAPSSGLTSPSLNPSKDNQCGRAANYGTSSVAKGVEAKRDDAPWHAGIYTKKTRPYMQICGGTIVSTNVVISAAHCFWTSIEKKLPAENFAVAVGKLYRPWNDPNDDKMAQKSDILEIRMPPRFHGAATNFQDDIALLKLKEILIFTPTIVPICLDFEYDFDETQLAHGNIGRVVGWGLTSEDGNSSSVLNKAELPIVGIEKCAADANPAFLESITSDKICAGYNNGTAVCRGDSGGGLAFREFVDDKYRFYLRGVVSTAPTNDHLCNVYAVATFTHIIKHERFIRIGILEIRMPPRFHGAATNFQDDIALLKLKEILIFTPTIVPICLDFEYDFDETQLAHGNIGRVVGWGLTSEDGNSSSVLNKAELPIVGIEKCAADANPAFLESITSDKICAGYNNGTAVCRGDSGGGLAFREFVDDKYRFYLRGVVSTAPTNDHLCNVYAVATFTHIIKHERFIRIGISQSPPPNIVPEAPVITALNKGPEHGSNSPSFDTSGSGRPPNGLDKEPTTRFDNRHLNDAFSYKSRPIPYIPHQTSEGHESPQIQEPPCKPEDRTHLIGISSYEKPGAYVKPRCNENRKTSSLLASNKPSTYTNHGSDIRPSINNSPVNNGEPISNNNEPLVYDVPIVYNKAVIYEATVVYEGPVNYMSHVTDEPDVRFGSDDEDLMSYVSMMYERLPYNEELLRKEGYSMYDEPVSYGSSGTYARSISYDQPVFDKHIYKRQSVISYRSSEYDDYPIVFHRPVIYKQSVVYEKPVTYKESKLFYDKKTNQFRKDVVALLTGPNNQGVKIEIGIANNNKDTPNAKENSKNSNEEYVGGVKLENEGKIKGNKDILKPNNNKDKSVQNNEKNAPTGTSSNQGNTNKNIQNKKPYTPSPMIIDDYDDDEHYVNPSKPNLFDKNHPINQATNLNKPDKKQPTHWHPLMPESWPFFRQGQDLSSGNKNPDAEDEDSNLNVFVPEGYKLFRQQGLSHQSTNILINTHNGPVTIGDISSVVNFYYKSANRTIPNV